MNDACEDLLRGPFTPTMAARRGVGRAALERMLRQQEVIRLIRGVYLGSQVSAGPGMRAHALGLVVGRRATVVGRTAAWLHGCAAEALLVGLDASRGVPIELRPVGARMPPSSLTQVHHIRVATPPAVAADLARRLPGGAALAALDGLLRCGALSHRDLLARARARSGEAALPPELAARCDGRADGPAESVLRMHWLDARLPTPAPGLLVGTERISLGLPGQRYGVVVARRPPMAALDGWRALGWRVTWLDGAQVLGTEPALVRGHLEREFHQHLLLQVAAEPTA